MHKIDAVVVEIKFLHVVKEADERNGFEVIVRKRQNSDIGESFGELVYFREDVVVEIEFGEFVQFVEERKGGDLIVGEVQLAKREKGVDGCW